MIQARPRRRQNVTLWYVYRMPAEWPDESYEVDTPDSDAAHFGKQVDGPYSGPLGFSRAYSACKDMIKKKAREEAKDNAR